MKKKIEKVLILVPYFISAMFMIGFGYCLNEPDAHGFKIVVFPISGVIVMMYIYSKINIYPMFEPEDILEFDIKYAYFGQLKFSLLSTFFCNPY